MSTQNDSRWWEFYGVRYAMGTVIGALIVYYIFKPNVYLSELLFLPKDTANFGMAHLVLLAAYGMAYCYIASAPILIMHAGRAFLWQPVRENNWRKTANRLGIVIAPAVLVGEFFWLISSAENFVELLYQSAAVTVFMLMLSFQAVLLIRIFLKSAQYTGQYYLKLIEQREQEDMRSFVESYRHLREHGNSFLIVCFEFWLGFVISAFTNAERFTNSSIHSDGAVRNLLLILLLWVIPASGIWFFGNKLEHRLAQGQLKNSSRP